MASTRINISVPETLAKRIHEMEIPVSLICQMALSREVRNREGETREQLLENIKAATIELSLMVQRLEERKD